MTAKMYLLPHEVTGSRPTKSIPGCVKAWSEAAQGEELMLSSVDGLSADGCHRNL